MLVAFIDAGFLTREGVRSLGLPSSVRSRIDGDEIVRLVESLLPRGPDLLRIYWYDGAYDASHASYAAQRAYFNAIADTPGIQLRLGHLVERTPGWHNAVRKALANCGVDLADFEKHFEFRIERQQKGVDTLLALDLVRLAQRRVFGVAVVISGDRDLAEAIRTAQDEGCRVVIARPERAGIARELRQLADELVEIPERAVRRALGHRVDEEAPPPAHPE